MNKIILTVILLVFSINTYAQTDFPTKTLAINGTNLAYIEAGEGVPVVLVHGALADLRYWPLVFEELAKSYHVLSLSRRSFYPNEHDSESQTGQLDIDDLAAFISSLGLAPVHLIGHSSGGHISLGLASQYPQLIRSFTTIEGGFLSDGVSEEVAAASTSMDPLIEQSLLYLAEGKPDLAASTFLDAALGPGYYDSFSDEIKQTVLDNIHTIGHSLAELSCSDANKISVPTLLIEGELSPAIIPLSMSALKQCIPGISSVLIKNASHDVFIDNPVDFNLALLSFLDSFDNSGL